MFLRQKFEYEEYTRVERYHLKMRLCQKKKKTIFTRESSLFQIIMRTWLLLACALTVVVVCSSQGAPNKYENYNADSIIQNERILLAYYKCVMDKGPCTKDGKNFKRKLCLDSKNRYESTYLPWLHISRT